MSRFFVYAYFRPDGETPCYVGKGTAKRLRKHKAKHSHNLHLKAIARNSPEPLRREILAEGLEEVSAFALERDLIQLVGREPIGPLVNKTNGGEGASGFPPEVIAKIIAAQKGKPKSEAAKIAMRIPKGPMTEVNKEKIKIGQASSEKWQKYRLVAGRNLKGRKQSEAHIRASALARLGYTHSKETRAKMSKAAKNRKPMTEAHRAALSEAIKGRVVTQETRRKIKEAQAGRKKTPEAGHAAMVGRNLTFLAKRFMKQLGDHCTVTAEDIYA